MSVTLISPKHLSDLCGKNRAVDLFDVRPAGDYAAVHIPQARSLPFDQLDAAGVRSQRMAPADEPVYLVCNAGVMSRRAGEKLTAQGMTNVISVDGGTQAWVAAGLPVVHGASKAISLERQVRIVAGMLVLVGVALGYFLHPGFLGIAAFVGAGLIFAGVTNRCGMAMLLLKMPWNRPRSGT
ncbi:MAG: DUF2892 domain-containing protein [Planctomycetes bacterium]|nr:DUF2892 domain-containing protein [Planctomycetota bacterium]